MGAKYPKTVAKIVDDADVLLEFYRYGRTLGAPSHHETDRKCLCHSTFETQGDKGARIVRCRTGDGLQPD
jgi:hypothetical protein